MIKSIEQVVRTDGLHVQKLFCALELYSYHLPLYFLSNKYSWDKAICPLKYTFSKVTIFVKFDLTFLLVIVGKHRCY